MTLVLLALIGLGTAFFVLGPLLWPETSATPAGGQAAGARAALDLRKSIVYENIEDLEFEREMGKLSDDDYQRLRGELTRDAVAVLKDLDRLSGEDRLDQIIDLELERLRRGDAAGRSGS